MKIVLAVGFFLLLLSPGGTPEKRLPAAPSVRLAEGVYAVAWEDQETGEKQRIEFGAWTLFREPAGGYRVENRLLPPPGAERPPPEVISSFFFDTRFRLTGFERRGELDDTRFQLACEMEPNRVRCRLSGADDPAGTVVEGRVEQPYALLGELIVAPGNLADLPWLMAQVVRDVPREPGRDTRVTLVGFGDEELDTSEAVIVRHLDRETIPLAGRSFQAHKFSITETGHDEPTGYAWVSDLGILLRLESPDGLVFELSRYTEFASPTALFRNSFAVPSLAPAWPEAR